jgi:hypothetical protein
MVGQYYCAVVEHPLRDAVRFVAVRTALGPRLSEVKRPERAAECSPRLRMSGTTHPRPNMLSRCAQGQLCVSGRVANNTVTAGLQAALFWAVTQRVVAWRRQLEVEH